MVCCSKPFYVDASFLLPVTVIFLSGEPTSAMAGCNKQAFLENTDLVLVHLPWNYQKWIP
jgi:hypothetical protein